MKTAMIMLIAMVFGLGACNKNIAPEQQQEVQQILESKHYVFKAETANPMSGSTVRLSYGYDLVINAGELVATLPYYGRAYTADRNFTGMRFTSTNFTYTTSNRGDGGWEIVIQPADVAEVQELRMIVSADGYATLNITSTNRTPISYYGTVQKK